MNSNRMLALAAAIVALAAQPAGAQSGVTTTAPDDYPDAVALAVPSSVILQPAPALPPTGSNFFDPIVCETIACFRALPTGKWATMNTYFMYPVRRNSTDH